MRPQEIIKKKRDGGTLSHQEIDYFVQGVIRGQIADYQASALLMAIYLRGMSDDEQQALTESMLQSGKILDFSSVRTPMVDKHSTGGVGDKTSLVLAPLVASCGVSVPMISGRGLGHTGGTLDKLESIPGYRVNLSAVEFEEVLGRVGFAMAGQTEELAPADKKIYALRDATATVEAIPLIVGSIISKKASAGVDALVVDVKVGTGAFMRDVDNARALAHALVKTGNSLKIRTKALLTDMNQPLGRAVGNSLEVKECIDILRGDVNEANRPVLELSLELSSHMLVLAKVSDNLEMAREKLQRSLDSGEALERLRRNVETQGGDPRVCDQPENILPLTSSSFPIEAPVSGFITYIDASEIGAAIAAIGGGRLLIGDAVDPRVGLTSDLKIGSQVGEGEELAVLYCADESLAKQAVARIAAAYRIRNTPDSQPPKLVKEIIEE